MNNLYEDEMAKKLFESVKIFCWVFTHPENHETKARHVKNTWGDKCNKLVFMSTVENESLGIIAVPVENGREQLWNKTQHVMKYASFDGFLHIQH